MFMGEQPFRTFAYEKKDSAISGVSIWPKERTSSQSHFHAFSPTEITCRKGRRPSNQGQRKEIILPEQYQLVPGSQTVGKKAKEKGTRKVGEAGERKKEGGPVIISFTTLDWSA